jgi:hypothetical protein
MSDDRGVTSSEETGHVSLMQVTPATGKGTLDLWWFHHQRGVRTQSRVKPYVWEGTRPGANHGRRGACESALKPRQAGKASGGNTKIPNRTVGKPAVRNYRGASGNVALQLARRSSIPTRLVSYLHGQRDSVLAFEMAEGRIRNI